MKTVATMTRADLGAFVQEHLRNKGLDMVLSGGACVSIYSENKYPSMDLDMIHTSLMTPKRKLIRDAMSELGFIEEGRYFKHPDTDLFVEFPPGPPAVGQEPVKEIQERHEVTGILKIISPTDCVKDRLTGFYHDNDSQCLDQAVLVAQHSQIDIKEVERWSQGEGKLEQFKQIRKHLEKKA
ncbi:MAG: hypothetical protein V1800_04135 [Candidatus Latescibacterota bacterium]